MFAKTQCSISERKMFCDTSLLTFVSTVFHVCCATFFNNQFFDCFVCKGFLICTLLAFVQRKENCSLYFQNSAIVLGQFSHVRHLDVYLKLACFQICANSTTQDLDKSAGHRAHCGWILRNCRTQGSFLFS